MNILRNINQKILQTDPNTKEHKEAWDKFYAKKSKSAANESRESRQLNHRATSVEIVMQHGFSTVALNPVRSLCYSRSNLESGICKLRAKVFLIITIFTVLFVVGEWYGTDLNFLSISISSTHPVTTLKTKPRYRYQYIRNAPWYMVCS
jgi:hypothetical protein